MWFFYRQSTKKTNQKLALLSLETFRCTNICPFRTDFCKWQVDTTTTLSWTRTLKGILACRWSVCGIEWRDGRWNFKFVMIQAKPSRVIVKIKTTGKTFLNPTSAAYSLKHRRHIFKPYFLISPWWFEHTRLKIENFLATEYANTRKAQPASNLQIRIQHPWPNILTNYSYEWAVTREILIKAYRSIIIAWRHIRKEKRTDFGCQH